MATERPARASTPVVAPEVAARVVACRQAGKCAPEIGRSLQLTLGEVSAVLGAADLAVAVDLPR